MMESREEEINREIFRTVSKLANLLRRSGSAVLTNNSALSLTWTVFQNISKALAMFSNNSLDPGQGERTDMDMKLILDLEYLSTFLARVPSLRLLHTSRGRERGHEGLIHLSGLTHLSSLILRRVPVNSITDLDALRSQLESLSVSRAQLSVCSLLSSCLGSSPRPAPWTSLSQLSLTHCQLTSMSPALSLVPGLTSLDCSHNRITDCTGLESLALLSCLSLSYNLLTYVPTIHPSAPLTTLRLSYNNIEQLGPVSEMGQLEHLELAANCLMHHDALAPVSGLTRLVSLDLRFTPISTHPRHRELASSWLHPGLASLQPSLDTAPLTRAESVQVGSSRLVISPGISPARPVSEEHEDQDGDTGSVLDDLPESVSLCGSREGSSVSGRRRRRGKSRRKLREAVISDETEIEETGTEHTETGQREGDEVTSHIQGLRQRYGDNWLNSGASDTLHTLLGISQSEAGTVEADQSEAEAAISGENVKIVRRSSDEVPDAIDKVEDENRTSHEVSQDVKRTEHEAPGVSVYEEAREDRENSPDLSHCTKVNVLRSIPGDDSGLLEELVLLVDREFIRERAARAEVTRTKWFTSSLEQMELVKREGGGSRSDHVIGDTVGVLMVFNTVRSEARERLYTMSEAGHATLMALTSGVLEAVTRGALAIRLTLQCVRCGAVWTAEARDQGNRCPKCGSNMILERTEGAGDGLGPEDEAEEVSLGIPACEMLDLAAITQTPGTRERERSDSGPTERSFRAPHPAEDCSPLEPAVVAMSVKADIHCHTVNSPGTNLPDLLPRPEPSPSSTPPFSSSPQETSSSSSRLSKEKSVTRSDSSSDISVLSNPSEASIEVIRPEVTLQPPSADVVTSAVSPIHHELQESSSTDSMVSSQVREPGDHIEAAHENCQDCQEDRESIYDFYAQHETPPSSAYSSTQTSPAKKKRDKDGVSLDDGDTTVFLSCQEDTDTDPNDDSRDDTTLISPPHEPSESPDPDREVSEVSVMQWNYETFTRGDHRLMLHLELSLFKEAEELLVLAKGRLYCRSHPGAVRTGLVVVSNKRVYCLAISGKETEHPEEWLELVTCAEVTKLAKIVVLLGGQGIGLEIVGSHKPPAQTFYRLSGAGTGEAGDTYYLVLDDRQRTEALVDCLVERLQERVRSAPIPVTRTLGQEQEELLRAQLELDKLELCVSTSLMTSDLKGWELVSVILTSDLILVTEDFFSWLLTSRDKKLDVRHQRRVETLENLSIYQRWPERTSLELPEVKLRLKFATEAGIQEFVRSLRQSWERQRGVRLEEVTSFHLDGSQEVVRMTSLMMEDSVSRDSFHLPTWIKVTSSSKDRGK